MPDYQMVCYTSKSGTFGRPVSSLEFNKKVNELLADGYELYGPPSVLYYHDTTEYNDDCIVFSQALLKP